MSKSASRGSLIGLKSQMPALPRVAPVATTPEMEELILSEQSLSKDDHTDVSTSVRKDSKYAAARARGSRKEPTVLMNAKLPVSLHARLKRTAQFNDISMTDILIRALEVELASGGYTPPPETWGSASSNS